MVLTKLHAGGKFGGDGYKVSGGLHGVGVSVVNALSEWLIAEVRRDGKVYRQEFARGEPITDIQTVGVAQDTGRRSPLPPPTATSSRKVEWSIETLVNACARPFLTQGLRIVLDEALRRRSTSSHYEGGIRDFVSYVNESKDPVHKGSSTSRATTARARSEVAMQWNTSYQESVFSFANNINTIEGGTHLSG